MAGLQPTFDLTFIGGGTYSGGTDQWTDLSDAIPSGKQLWLGYATLISDDKTLTFELRPNLIGQSTGTVGNTVLRGFASVLAGDSTDLDLFYYGNIITLAPVTAQSTGVEKLWLRIKSGSASSGTWSYIIYYTLY